MTDDIVECLYCRKTIKIKDAIENEHEIIDSDGYEWNWSDYFCSDKCFNKYMEE